MKGMLKDAAILLVITLISGLVLGFVYDITKEPIKAQELSKEQAAYKEVFADAGEFETVYDSALGDEGQTINEQALAGAVASTEADAQISKVVAAKDAAGQVLGYVLVVTDHEGYGGDITFAMGIDNAALLKGVSILSISETAGLGMRAGEVLVPQMPGKDLSQDVTYTKSGDAQGNEVDAISGATITTNAFVNGINAGRAVFMQLLAAGN